MASREHTPLEVGQIHKGWQGDLLPKRRGADFHRQHIERSLALCKINEDSSRERHVLGLRNCLTNTSRRILRSSSSLTGTAKSPPRSARMLCSRHATETGMRAVESFSIWFDDYENRSTGNKHAKCGSAKLKVAALEMGASTCHRKCPNIPLVVAGLAHACNASCRAAFSAALTGGTNSSYIPS